MQRNDNSRPVIIRRKKVSGGDGHHGGAWKVAYADFVTAMMAFFLMLWLIGSVDDERRKGIADYFSPTHSVRSKSSGGDGVLGGEALSPVDSIADEIATRDRYESDQAVLAELAERLQQMSGHSPIYEQVLQHVQIRLTDQGLVVEIFDLPDAPLFQPRSDEPNPILLMLIDLITDVFRAVANPAAIVAHSAAFPAVVQTNPVWPLTMSRAQAVKGLLTDAGFAESRIWRVTGHADRSLAVTTNPMEPRNNRIELVLLRSGWLHSEGLGRF